MSQICEHGYFPQRLGDGPCEVCEDLADLKRENSAWRALAAWSAAAPGRRFEFVRYNDDEWSLCAISDDPLVEGDDAESPAAAAIALATKLNLLAPKA